MKISIQKVKESAIIPKYQTEGSAGMDLHACIDEAVVLEPGEHRLVPTGIAIALPNGYEAQVRARSGLAHKHGISLVNGIGTVDADYRGEIGVLIINHGSEDFVIEPQMRIAQLVIAQYEKIVWSEKASLKETVRGAGGFGSTELSD